jgi:hypothetical protein
MAPYTANTSARLHALAGGHRIRSMKHSLQLAGLLACLFFSLAVSAKPPMLETLEGQPVQTGSLGGGRLLLFWHPDCTYCLRELSDLRKADAALLAQTTTVALLPAQNVHRGGYKLPAAALNLASRANPMDILEAFGDEAGLLPYAVITRADHSICRKLTGELSLDDFRQALASCR